MAAKPLPSPEVLRQLLSYDPETGVLTWREREPHFFCNPNYAECWNARWAGSPALTAPNGEGYLTGAVLKVPVKAHRVAFAIFHGRWPAGVIDHVNGRTDDNRIANLRDCTDLENIRNQKKRSGTSSFKGVTWRKREQKWYAQAQSQDGKRVYLGVFSTEEDAARAYDIHALTHYGQYARPNFGVGA